MELEILDSRASRLLVASEGVRSVASGFVFTEGPLWDAENEALLFSDIPANRIYRWREGSAAEVFREPSGKSNGLTWSVNGALIACEHLNRRVSVTRKDGRVAALADSYQGRRLNSPNDVVSHSGGRVYFSDPPYGIQSESVGAIAEQEQPLNGLYLIADEGAEPTLVVEGLDRPNGLAFSPDERLLYVNDTPLYQVHVFHVEADGTLTGGRVFAQFSADQGEGRPDGMKIDVEGNVYSTGPGGLWILNPAGEVLARVRLPEKSANCAWAEDGRTLYITASTSIYRIRTQIRGIFPPRRSSISGVA
jgi:gluconolactonase